MSALIKAGPVMVAGVRDNVQGPCIGLAYAVSHLTAIRTIHAKQHSRGWTDAAGDQDAWQ